jgi:hypothetical protein
MTPSYLVVLHTCIFLSASRDLITAVYMGSWYEYDIKSRKALIILMECSKNPITITVGIAIYAPRALQR